MKAAAPPESPTGAWTRQGPRNGRKGPLGPLSRAGGASLGLEVGEPLFRGITNYECQKSNVE